MSPDRENEPPKLIRAVREAQLDRLKELLAEGMDPDTRTKAGRTALHAAAEEGLLEPARLLLDAGAEVDARNWAGETPLFSAAQYGWGRHLDDPDEERRPKVKRDPLDRREYLDIAKLLIDRGADVNALDGAGESVLAAAAAFGELVMIELLLARGADPNHIGDGHATPLESAIRYRRLDVAKRLRRSGAQIDGPEVRALQHAAGLGCLTVDGVRTVDYVRWLLEEGARVDGSAPYPAPLILAATTSDAESVQVLLEHGADVDARATGTRETALHAAGCALTLDVARLLLAAGASIDARDSSGGTVLHAILGQDYNGLACPELLLMLRLLIAHGADLSARDYEGLTPREVASAAALPADVIALLES